MKSCYFAVFVRFTHGSVPKVDLLTEVFNATEPFVSDHQGNVDRAAQDDIVDGVEGFWKQIDIEMAFLTNRPHPH